jgi:hypothetical protein
MATLSATFPPKSASGGISDSQTFTIAAAGTQSVTIGIRQLFALSTTGAIFVRFSFGSNSTATTADFSIPGANISQFDNGDEFDRVNILNNGASSVIVSVMRLNRAG